MLSIVIPVYNVEKYLRECLDSVLGQTCKDIEVICVDDGSTDGSWEILDEYALRDSRLRIFHQENSGVSVARNIGLDNIHGEFYTFIDSDDVLEPHAIESYLTLFTTAPSVDMVCLHGPSLFNDGKPYPWNGLDLDNEILPKSIRVYDTHEAIWDNETDSGFTKFAYRSSVCGGVRFKTYKYGEDRLYLIECLCVARCIASAYSLTYGYRMRDGSVMQVKDCSQEALLQQILWRVDSLRVIEKSKKHPPLSRVVELMRSILGVCTLTILKMDSDCRNVAWEQVSDAKKILRGFYKKGLNLKVCFFIMCYLDNRIFAVLFAVSAWIKKAIRRLV